MPIIEIVFGTALPDSGTPLSLGALIEDTDKYLDQEVLLDYGFFIPTYSGGKDVVLLGSFTRESVSKEEAEHYAEDLGETSAPGPESFQYLIVATAVKIPHT
ncbi:MAG: DUF4920 domain-containing protein [Gammaproteobacteria bacterium]|nr:DUF4920 domain-containing protein [Gammaproteobacteria bacterium]